MHERVLERPPVWVTSAARIIRALPAGRYRTMNLVGRRPSAPFWTTTPVDLGGLEFRCDLRDPLMREVCFTGRYEPQETLLMSRLLTQGMTFVDVGANWGYFTLYAAYLVGSHGRVISVEADPRAWRVLKANVDRNALSQVSLFASAASDVAGTLSMFRYGHETDDAANFGVTIATSSVPHHGSRFDVEARPLDDVLDDADVERVDFLKMDIEGAEARALRGLERRLSRGLIDRILLELHPAYLQQQGESSDGVITFLEARGLCASHIPHSPAAYKRAASRDTSRHRVLTALPSSQSLGEWPHLFWERHGLSEGIVHEAGLM